MDFNARVGILDDEVWHGVVGQHGMAERNMAGEEFLQFCALNQLTAVMNTWYQKEIYFGTWMYPATKALHVLDLVVMRANQRACCKDVQGQIAGLIIGWLGQSSDWVCEYLVEGKRECCPSLYMNFLASREEYRCHLEQKLQEHPHCPDLLAEDNWEMLKSCIVSAAEKTIGRGEKKQPEWFEESAELLIPLIERKNEAHSRALKTNSVAARKEFRHRQREVKRAVDKAREQWNKRVAMEGEKAKKDGRTRWESIRMLQRTHARRKSVRQSAVRKENGEVLMR